MQNILLKCSLTPEILITPTTLGFVGCEKEIIGKVTLARHLLPWEETFLFKVNDNHLIGEYSLYVHNNIVPMTKELFRPFDFTNVDLDIQQDLKAFNINI